MQSKLAIYSSLIFTLFLCTIIRAQPNPEEGDEEVKPGKEEEPKPGKEGETKPGKEEEPKPGKEGETKPGKEEEPKPGKEDEEKLKPEDENLPVTAVLAQIATLKTLEPAETGDIFVNGYGTAWYFVDKKTGEIVENITDIDAVRIEVPALTILLETFKKLLPKDQKFIKSVNQKIQSVMVVLAVAAEDKKPGKEDEDGDGDDKDKKPGKGGDSDDKPKIAEDPAGFNGPEKKKDGKTPKANEKQAKPTSSGAKAS